MFILLLLIVSLLFLFVSLKDKKLVYFLPLFIVCAILIGGNTNNPDTGVYYDIYYGSEFFSKDVGFGYLVYFSKNILGFTFDQFRFFTYYVCLFLLFFTASKFTNNLILFLIILLSYQLFMQTVYFRNFISLTIFCFAFFNFRPTSIKNAFIMILFFCLACLIQKSFLFIIGIYFISFIISKYSIFRYFYIIISLTLGILINIDFFYNFIIDVLTSLNLSGLTLYLKRETKLGWIINWGFAAINLVFMYAIFKKAKTLKLNKSNHYYIEKIYYMNLAGLCALFLYVINATFGRILDNIIFISYFIFCWFITERLKNRKSGDKIIIYFLIFIVLLFVFGIKIVYEGYFETIVINMFTSNWILFGIPSSGHWVTDSVSVVKDLSLYTQFRINYKPVVPMR